MAPNTNTPPEKPQIQVTPEEKPLTINLETGPTRLYTEARNGIQDNSYRAREILATDIEKAHQGDKLPLFPARKKSEPEAKIDAHIA